MNQFLRPWWGLSGLGQIHWMVPASAFRSGSSHRVPDRCAAARDAALPFVDEFNVREFLPERTEEEEHGQFAFGRAAS